MFVKQKIAKLKFVKWTLEIERIVELKTGYKQIPNAFTILFMAFILLYHKIEQT